MNKNNDYCCYVSFSFVTYEARLLIVIRFFDIFINDFDLFQNFQQFMKFVQQLIY